MKLLPNYFKLIAIAFLLLSGIGFLIFKLNVDSNNVSLIREFTQGVFLMSLLALSMSKDKNEDELTVLLRLRAFMGSFIFGTSIVSIKPMVSNLLRSDYASRIGSFELLVSMFFFYFLIFYLSKVNR